MVRSVSQWSTIEFAPPAMRRAKFTAVRGSDVDSVVLSQGFQDLAILVAFTYAKQSCAYLATTLRNKLPTAGPFERQRKRTGPSATHYTISLSDHSAFRIKSTIPRFVGVSPDSGLAKTSFRSHPFSSSSEER